jgi:hypothetical protein
MHSPAVTFAMGAQTRACVWSHLLWLFRCVTVAAAAFALCPVAGLQLLQCGMVVLALGRVSVLL